MLRQQAICLAGQSRYTGRRLHVSAAVGQDDRGAGGGGMGETGAERNILLEAEQELEGDESNDESLLQRQRDALSREPVWEGDERVQDTVLRMLMDKYQPLRVKGQEAVRQHPSDAKMASVQKPSMIGSPSLGTPSSSAAIGDVGKITADLPQADEEGRRLAKTPVDKPWRAVYVNPMLTTENSQPAAPSIYYAKYIGLPTAASGSRVLPKTARGKDRLKLAGIKTESLPLDDTNKMRAIREGVRRWDRAGRMRGVKEEAMQYRRMREEERDAGGMSDGELDELLNAEGVLREGEEMHLSSTSNSKPGEASIAMSGGRGFASIANERIEAAMKTDYFRRNSLRGKPMEVDMHASNPFLKGEERIMNRLIQRQGAAPPWVELNVQLEGEQSDFRKRLADSWLRRASRMILASSHLRSGMEPVHVSEDDSFEAIEESTSLSSGQRKLLNLVKAYTDVEWETREQAYHDASLRSINSLIRRYNVVAPTSARRGLLVREAELIRIRNVCRVDLARRLSNGLLPGAGEAKLKSSVSATQTPPPTSGWFGSSQYTGTQSDTAPSSDMAAGRAARTLYGSEDGVAAGGSALDHQERRWPPTSQGLAAYVRRTAQRARQLIYW